MKASIMLIVASCLCAVVSARPLVLESQELLPAYADGFGFAGNEVISTNTSVVPNTDPERFRTTASLYRRGSDGKWLFVRDLATEVAGDWRASVGMTSTVAAISMPGGLRIFERSSSGWTEAAVDPAARLQGWNADVFGNNVVLPGFDCSPAAIVTRGANGVWAIAAQLAAPAGGCIDNADLDDGRVIVHVDHGDDAPGTAAIFERSGTAWNAVAMLQPKTPAGNFDGVVALRGTLAIVSDEDRGANVFRRTSAGWQPAGLLTNPDSYDGGQTDFAIGITDQYVMTAGWNINRRTSVANVFRRLADQSFEHVAIVAPPDVDRGFSPARIDGNRVVGQSYSELYSIDLPTSFVVPPLVQDDFESGSGGQWALMPGSQFTVVSNGQTRVFRQANVTGDAGAIYPADLTNQHVSADIRPISFTGNSSWVGLMTRHTDASNYYYVTLRKPDRLVLKRVVNGVITQLASYSTSASLQWHRLGLESSGTLQSVYIDGTMVMQTHDAALSHGRPGIRTYRANADFDNVVVTPGPLAALSYTDRVATGGAWSAEWAREAPYFSQTSVSSGDARAVTGLPRVDVSVQANVSVDGVATSGTPWAGLIARYVDSSNYYYVTVRANEISLRKLTNGAITALGSHAFTRTLGVPVNLRLEALGDRLRVYVNDELWIEHAGADAVAGKVGVMTYRAAASFTNFWAIEP